MNASILIVSAAGSLALMVWAYRTLLLLGCQGTKVDRRFAYAVVSGQISYFLFGTIVGAGYGALIAVGYKGFRGLLLLSVFLAPALLVGCWQIRRFRSERRRFLADPKRWEDNLRETP